MGWAPGRGGGGGGCQVTGVDGGQGGWGWAAGRVAAAGRFGFSAAAFLHQPIPENGKDRGGV